MAREAARRVGLDATGAEVLRVRTSIHVALSRADVVARVEGPGGMDSSMTDAVMLRTI